MNTKKLYSAIAAFNAVISDTPEAEDVNYTEDDTADYDAYDNAVDQIISGIDTAMNVLIKGAYFAIVEAPEHITPTVFATEEERDSFVTNIVEHVTGITCKPIDYNTFTGYTSDEENNPACYNYDEEENAILYNPFGWN